MGVDNVMPDDEVDKMIDDAHNITLQQLIQRHGEGAVRRGLSYMLSLDDAEREWKRSAEKSKNYGQEYIESVTEESTDSEAEKSVQSDWEEGMREGGLGLDE